MGVFISDNELNTFNQNGISEAQVQDTITQYRNEGISDDEIRSKIDAKLGGFGGQATPSSQPQKLTSIPKTENAAKTELDSLPPLPEIIDLEQQNDSEPTKLIAGGVEKKYTQNWDKNGKVYLIDEQGNKVEPDNGLNWLEKQGRKVKSWASNFGSWINETNPNSDAYKEKANLILAAETMPIGAGSKAVQAGTNLLKPFVGKAVARGVSEGVGGGFLAGGVEGVGRGLIDGENPLKTGLQDAALSSVFGGLGGAAIAKGAKVFKGAKLKNHIPFEEMTKEERQAYRKLGKTYYKDYIQGTSVTKDDYGKVNFTGSSSGKDSIHNLDKYPDLKKQIKTATVGEPTNDKLRDDNIEYFDHLGNKIDNKDMDYIIAVDENGKKYYMSKDITNKNELADQFHEQPVSEQQAHTNIITDNAENFNPVEAQEKIAIGALVPDSGINSVNNEIPTQFVNEVQLAKGKKSIQNDIDNLKSTDTKKTYITRSYKNRFWKENVDDPLTKDIIDADTELNSILDEIKKNPSVINDNGKIEELETRLNAKVNFPDDELNSSYWGKFYNALEKSGDFDNINTNFEMSEKLRQAGELKKSRLPQSADLPKDLQAGIDDIAPEYMVLHNKDLMAQSQKIVKENADVLQSDLLSRAAQDKNNFEALDFENARQLVSKLYQEGRLDEALDLTDLISQKGSKAGQAVQSMSLWAKTTPEGAVRQAQRLIAQYNKSSKKQLPKLTAEQAQEVMDLAMNIHKQTDDRARDVATAQLLKYQSDLIPVNGWQKAKTLRNISLLLNPKTLTRNIAGNGIFNGMDGLSKNLAAGIDGIVSKFTGKSTRAFTPIESTKAALSGAIKGAKEGFQDAKLGIDTRGGIGGRFDLPSQRSFKDPVFGGLETALDVGLRVPDRAFYQGLSEESVVNQLKAQGLKEATPEIIERANKEALEGVFQNDSAISQSVLGARKALNKVTDWISPNSKTFGLGDMVIPYAQTPANIVQQGINYSPAGLMKAVINGVKGDQRQATLDAARGIIGTGVMGAGYAGAKSGALNGDYEDYNVRKNLETLNDRPFQFNLPDGKGVSYSQLQPVSIPLSAGTALAQSDKEKAIQSAIGTVTELPMLDSMSKLIRDSQNYGIGTGASNLMMNIPSQFIPTALNQVNSYVDPIQRETYDPNPIMRGINQARNKVPIASKALPEKYNVKGEEIPKYESEGVGKALDVFINPVFVNKKKDDLVMQEVKALYDITGEKGSLLAVPERKIKIDGEQRQLSGKEYSAYSKALGEETYKSYQQLMNTPRYQNADDKDRLKLLGIVKENAKSIVQEELFNKTDKNSPKNAIQRKINNRVNKGQRKIDRIMNKMDNQLIDNIMYEE